MESDFGMKLEPTEDGRWRIRLYAPPGCVTPRNGWVTSYPRDLIDAIYATKGMHTCDEICREEDPLYVERSLRNDVLGYVSPANFAGMRVLDFGCGSGASAMVLSRLLPGCEIVGIELEEGLLKIARLRADHFSRNVQFHQSPSGDQLPEGIGRFDFVMFNAVFEHLLPHERPMLLPLIWDHLNPGGILFLNQTPHRYSPFENHTTKMPLINYLPDELAHRLGTLSRRIPSGADWNTLLRMGIRGGTVREILGILGTNAELMSPLQGDRIDLWLGGLSSRHAWFKQVIWGSLKMLKVATRLEITPDLALALRKRVMTQ